jgi:capsular polysaccharide biosynthesis protein
MAEFMPKVWTCMQRPGFAGIPILMDEQVPKQLVEALRYFVGEQHLLVIVKPGQRVAVQDLWVCTMPTYFAVGAIPERQNSVGMAHQCVDPDFYLLALKQAQQYARHRHDPGPEGPRRVYLARRGLHHQLTNDAEVEAVFGAHGFESFDFYRLPFREQVALMASADVVAGPDGSAFYMTYFGKPGLTIILLASPFVEGHEHYAQITQKLGQRYFIVQGNFAQPASGYLVHAPYRIDPSRLNESLVRLLEAG